MKIFSQDCSSLGTKSKKVQQRVRHHLFTPLPQYCINKFWITCFSHAFLTKPQHQADFRRNDACSLGMSADNFSNRQSLTQPFPLGKKSLPHIPGQFGITGHTEVNAKHSACISTKDSLCFVTQLHVTCIT